MPTQKWLLAGNFSAWRVLRINPFRGLLLFACCLLQRKFSKTFKCLVKCNLCSFKSSSRWFKFLDFEKNFTRTCCACFNVINKRKCWVMSLCASCRRNLIQWRDSRPTNEKYFKLANSRGKPFLNKVLIAGQNQKLALLRRNSSEFPPLFQLLEDVFLDDCLSCLFIYLEAQTNQPDKHAAL